MSVTMVSSVHICLIGVHDSFPKMIMNCIVFLKSLGKMMLLRTSIHSVIRRNLDASDALTGRNVEYGVLLTQRETA